MRKIKFKNKGFTLIELLVTIAIFSIIIGTILGIFISGIRQQRIALTTQTILDQASYALEYMSRALRMAKKELGEGCLPQRGFNYQLTRGGSGLKFINTLEENDCQEFFLEDGQLKYWKKRTGQTLALTSGKLEITSLKFNLVGESQIDNFQPRVTLLLEITGKLALSQKIKIQTTISQRNLDVRY